MDVQAQTIGSAPPASEREEHFADTAPVSPRKTPEQRTTGRARQTCPSHRRGRIGIRGDAGAELIGDATERLREQLIECDDEIRDLRYRLHLRGYNPTVVRVVVPTPMPLSGSGTCRRFRPSRRICKSRFSKNFF
jgi:hypothetical protein